MNGENPTHRILQIALVLNNKVGVRTGIEPLLSAATYDYGLPRPDWDWSKLGHEIEQVQKELDFLPIDRAAFLNDLLQAFAMMVREGQGDDIPYAERVATYLQVPGQPVPEYVIEALQRELCALLIEADYPDDLGIALRQWRQRQAIAGSALIEKGRAFLEQAAKRTNQIVWPLPEEQKVTLSFPKNYPYRGYSDYARNYEGRVHLSGDIQWETAALKHVVCHESFPGHQAYSAIRERSYRTGNLGIEGTLYFSNTPITPIVEGMCEIGQEILGMIESIDDRIYHLYNRFSTAVNTNLAFGCNAGGMDRETAIRQMMRKTYVPRVFAEKFYEFWTNPLWCTSFPHYWYGAEIMRQNCAQMKGRYPELFRMVYTEPHTVRTLSIAINNLLGLGGG